jgi:hypothetical protein
MYLVDNKYKNCDLEIYIIMQRANFPRLKKQGDSHFYQKFNDDYKENLDDTELNKNIKIQNFFDFSYFYNNFVCFVYCVL